MPKSESTNRRLADGQGYRLRKLPGDGGYQLFDLSTGGLVIGEQPACGVDIGYDLVVVEDWLTG